MKRTAPLALVAYGGFLLVVGWAVLFLANGPVATTVDGPPRSVRSVAVAVDLGLLLLFAVHHSLLARSSAKRRVREVVGPRLERSVYVLTADALLAAVLAGWQPVPGVMWSVTSQPGRALLWVVYGAGWVTAVSATFMIDHLDLVGIRQALGRPSPVTGFQVRWLYRWVRHPLMLGLLIAFWASPTMTAGHLLFAGAATAYIVVGVQLEERDLRRDLGQPYADYASRVPAIVPGRQLRRAWRGIDVPEPAVMSPAPRRGD